MEDEDEEVADTTRWKGVRLQREGAVGKGIKHRIVVGSRWSGEETRISHEPCHLEKRNAATNAYISLGKAIVVDANLLYFIKREHPTASKRTSREGLKCHCF